MDSTQLTAFFDYLIGGRAVGGSEADPLETPHSPELRAFIVGRLGECTPESGYRVVMLRNRNDIYARQAKALAALLREAADGIDPPREALS